MTPHGKMGSYVTNLPTGRDAVMRPVPLESAHHILELILRTLYVKLEAHSLGYTTNN